jgi:hypothetical protein
MENRECINGEEREREREREERVDGETGDRK